MSEKANVITPITAPPPERVARLGLLQFLKTQFQLLQQDCARIADRLESHAPDTADRFNVQAETWEVAAHIIIELQQGQPGRDDADYVNANKTIQSLALIRRFLQVRELMGKDNGAPD
jgi:hypothetical protein